MYRLLKARNEKQRQRRTRGRIAVFAFPFWSRTVEDSGPTVLETVVEATDENDDESSESKHATKIVCWTAVVSSRVVALEIN